MSAPSEEAVDPRELRWKATGYKRSYFSPGTMLFSGNGNGSDDTLGKPPSRKFLSQLLRKFRYGKN